MSNTPETDAVLDRLVKNQAGNSCDAVVIHHARKLERERDEAREAIRALAEHAEAEIQRITKERDEARESAAKWESLSDALERRRNAVAQRADENREWALKAEKERDEAMELVKYYQQYSKLLVSEINDTAALAHVCGWRSNLYEQGKVLREKIKQLEESNE